MDVPFDVYLGEYKGNGKSNNLYDDREIGKYKQDIVKVFYFQEEFMFPYFLSRGYKVEERAQHGLGSNQHRHGPTFSRATFNLSDF